MSWHHQLLLTMKNNRKSKTLLMLGALETKYNIGLSRLIEMKTANSIMLLDLIILQKLSRIFTPVILINRNLKQDLESEKEIDLLERPRI